MRYKNNITGNEVSITKEVAQKCIEKGIPLVVVEEIKVPNVLKEKAKE